MILSNLTTSGWVLFAIMLTAWLCFAIDLVRAQRGDVTSLRHHDLFALAVGTVWLLWLVTP